MADSLATQLVLDALDMALGQRRPTDVIHHSDQGSQYTSIAFGKRCREADVRPSMGSVGDAYDNAMCESFFATLECELIDRRRFRTKAEARLAFDDDAEAASLVHEYEAKIAVLERKVGQLTMEVDFLKGAQRQARSPSVETTSIVAGPVASASNGRANS
jgi:transposase InsO family protein